MITYIYRFIYQPQINLVLRNIFKIIYPLLPRKTRFPVSGVISLKNKSGKKLFIKTNQTNFLTKVIFYDGYETYEYTKIFIDLIKKMDTFYDIGASIGYYTLLAKMENPSILITAFEPASGPLHYLRQNVEINNYDNIKIEKIALSDKEGSITFYEIKDDRFPYLKHNLVGESNAGTKTTGRDFTPVEVKTTTLDRYVLQHAEQQSIDLIKMDTEGTESSILAHSDQVLSQMKPIVICETLYNTIEPELEAIFKKHGYHFYNHTPEGLQKAETIIRAADDGIRDCFFVPPEKVHLIEEFIVKPS